MRAEAEKVLGKAGHRVYAIVNYDHFEIAPELVNAWAQMVQGIVDQYYRGITRYTTSNFMRVKLGGCTLRSRACTAYLRIGRRGEGAPSRRARRVARGRRSG